MSSKSKQKSPAKSPKKGKSPTDKAILRAPIEKPEPYIQLKKTQRWQALDLEELNPVKSYRCSFCRLVYSHIDEFISHACWRKYFVNRLYLVDARTFRCMYCEGTFLGIGDYSIHKCIHSSNCAGKTPQAEQVTIIDKWDHLDFYINWRMRYEAEEYFVKKLVAICSKCEMKFYARIDFLVHSCAQTPRTKMFYICDACKRVFWSYEDRENHYLSSAPGIGNKDCLGQYELSLELRFPCLLDTTKQDFLNKLMERSKWMMTGPEYLIQLISWLREQCEPTMLPDDCKDFTIAECPKNMGCFKCGFKFDDHELFLLHTCIAGHSYDPVDLNLTIYCEKCECLFLKPEWFIKHLTNCVSEKILLTRPKREVEMRNFHRRWMREVWAEKFIPERLRFYRCDTCFRQLRSFKDFLIHIRQEHSKMVLPLQILETYACPECNYVAFTAHNMLQHRINCSVDCNVKMTKTVYTLEEELEALKMWMSLPRCMRMDLNIVQQKYNTYFFI